MKILLEKEDFHMDKLNKEWRIIGILCRNVVNRDWKSWDFSKEKNRRRVNYLQDNAFWPASNSFGGNNNHLKNDKY